MKLTHSQKSAIRANYGHNGVECLVRICANGDIMRYGSACETDRSADFWTVISTVEMEREVGVLSSNRR